MNALPRLAAIAALLSLLAGCVTTETVVVQSFTLEGETLTLPVRHDVLLEGEHGRLIPVRSLGEDTKFVVKFDFTYDWAAGDVLEALFVDSGGNVISLLRNDSTFYLEHPTPDDVFVDVAGQRVVPVGETSERSRLHGTFLIKSDASEGLLLFAWTGDIHGTFTTHWPEGTAIGPATPVQTDIVWMRDTTSTAQVAAPFVRAAVESSHEFGATGESVFTLVTVFPTLPSSTKLTVAGEDSEHHVSFPYCHCIERHAVSTNGRTTYDIELVGAYVIQPELLIMMAQLPAGTVHQPLTVQ